MNCPNCASDQWKLASLICAEGTTKTRSTSAIGGVGSMVGDAAPLVGLSISSQTEHTQLAERAAPPVREKVLWQRESQASHAALTAGLLTLGLAVGLILTLDGTEFDGILLTLIVIAAFLFAIFELGKSLFLMLFGPEAEENARRRNVAKREEEQRFVDAMARYERTRMCLRCGHLFIAD